jgi:hypothetical protein
VLAVLGHDAGIAGAVKLQPLALFPGAQNGQAGLLQLDREAALRYCKNAATELSMTLTRTSAGLSSGSTLRWMKGTPSLAWPASFSLKSARPS